MTKPIDLLVSRADLARAELRTPPARAPLAAGEARLAVRRLALTANNVTYGTFGDMMGYWKFFLAPEGWGRIPAWGFAEVVESRSDALRTGERVFGFVPMSDSFDVAPGNGSAYCVYDGSAHRAGLLPFYNRYVRVAADPLYDAAQEPAQAVLQVLFATSFLLFEDLRGAGFTDRPLVALTSASSKTAVGLAQLLHAAGVETAAVTGPRNVPFCRDLGVYAHVVAYDQIETLPKAETAFVVDFAGSAPARGRLHRHFGAAAARSVLVGGTHAAASGEAGDMPGAAPSFFFVPPVYDARLAALGPDGFAGAFGPAWRHFRASAERWFPQRERAGFEALLDAWRDVAKGVVDPSVSLTFRV